MKKLFHQIEFRQTQLRLKKKRADFIAFFLVLPVSYVALSRFFKGGGYIEEKSYL